MDQDDKQLLRRLMAKATAMLEDALEVAAAGQSPRLDPSQLADASRQLEEAAQNIAAIAEAAGMIADSGTKRPRKPRKSLP